ncbi:MAG: GYD domain-containing protein [Bryobacteraceae bacterium]
MPKFLIEASYTAEGIKGLTKDKASGRRSAVEKALTAAGGKLEAFYYAFGDTDAFVLCDFPDTVSAASLSIAVAAAGLVKIKTTPLLTIEEMDKALGKSVTYRAPGT